MIGMDHIPINFNFISPKLIFGRGKIGEIGKEVLNLLKGKNFKNPNVLLVTGKSSLKKSGYLDKINSILTENSISSYLYDKAVKEPTTEIVNHGKRFAIGKKLPISDWDWWWFGNGYC